MISLLLASTVWATPPDVEVGAVLLVRRTGLTVPQGRELETLIVRGLESGGVNVKLKGQPLADALKRLGVKDTAACAGRRSCVTELVAQLGLPSIVTVNLSRLDAETAAALEWSPPGSATPLKDAFVIEPGAKSLAEPLKGFAERIRVALRPPPEPPPVVTDAPTASAKVALVPAPAVAPPVVVAAEPARSHAPALVVGGLGVGSVLGGVALIVVSAVMRAEVSKTDTSGGLRTSTLREEDAVALNSSANVNLGVGIGLGAAGAALLTGAVVAW